MARSRRYRRLLEFCQGLKFETRAGEKPGKVVHTTDIRLDREEVNCLMDLLKKKLEE
jgi:hypothetical protein